jgi:hypothetical protein
MGKKNRSRPVGAVHFLILGGPPVLRRSGRCSGSRKKSVLPDSLMMGVAQRHRGWLPQAFHPQVFSSRLDGFIVRDTTGEKKGLRQCLQHILM